MCTSCSSVGSSGTAALLAQNQSSSSNKAAPVDSDGDTDGDTAAVDAAKAPGTGEVIDIKA